MDKSDDRYTESFKFYELTAANNVRKTHFIERELSCDSFLRKMRPKSLSERMRKCKREEEHKHNEVRRRAYKPHALRTG